MVGRVAFGGMLLVAVAVVGSGCHRDDDSVGGAGGAAEIPASTLELTNAAVESIASVVALAGPLVGGGDELRQEQDTATDARARDIVETAVAGNSIVTDPACVAFDWSGLSVTVTMTGCTLEATGMPVDGALTLAVTIKPPTFSMSFGALSIGDAAIDGGVTMSFSGGDPPSISTDADLSCTTASGETHLTLTDLTTSASATSIGVSGGGTIESATLSATLTLDGVTWVIPDRCPSAGLLVVDEAGDIPPVTVTFLPTTPDDGVVQVQRGGLPPGTRTLAFCTEG